MNYSTSVRVIKKSDEIRGDIEITLNDEYVTNHMILNRIVDSKDYVILYLKLESDS